MHPVEKCQVSAGPTCILQWTKWHSNITGTLPKRNLYRANPEPHSTSYNEDNIHFLTDAQSWPMKFRKITQDCTNGRYPIQNWHILSGATCTDSWYCCRPYKCNTWAPAFQHSTAGLWVTFRNFIAHNCALYMYMTDECNPMLQVIIPTNHPHHGTYLGGGGGSGNPRIRRLLAFSDKKKFVNSRVLSKGII